MRSAQFAALRRCGPGRAGVEDLAALNPAALGQLRFQDAFAASQLLLRAVIAAAAHTTTPGVVKPS